MRNARQGHPVHTVAPVPSKEPGIVQNASLALVQARRSQVQPSMIDARLVSGGFVQACHSQQERIMHSTLITTDIIQQIVKFLIHREHRRAAAILLHGTLEREQPRLFQDRVTLPHERDVHHDVVLGHGRHDVLLVTHGERACAQLHGDVRMVRDDFVRVEFVAEEVFKIRDHRPVRGSEMPLLHIQRQDTVRRVPCARHHPELRQSFRQKRAHLRHDVDVAVEYPTPVGSLGQTLAQPDGRQVRECAAPELRARDGRRPFAHCCRDVRAPRFGRLVVDERVSARGMRVVGKHAGRSGRDGQLRRGWRTPRAYLLHQEVDFVVEPHHGRYAR